jgi:hypothetical protein
MQISELVLDYKRDGRGGNDGGGRSACGGEVGARRQTLALSHTAHACIASACIARVRWCAARHRQRRKRRRDRASERAKAERGEVAVHACAGGHGSGLLLTLACARTRGILCPDAPLSWSVGALSVSCSLLPANTWDFGLRELRRFRSWRFRALSTASHACCRID